MKRIPLLLVGVATLAGVVAFTATTSRHVTAQDFHWAKSGEYIAQVTAIGPLGFEYVNSKDDPRNENSQR